MDIPFHQPTENKTNDISSCLQYHANTQPFQRALVYSENYDANSRAAYTHLTFRQLDQESDCLAAGLGDLGVTQGTKVFLLLKSGLTYYALIHALLKKDAIPILVDPAMGLKGIKDCLKSEKPDIFIGPPRYLVLKYIFPDAFAGIKTYITIEQPFLIKAYTLDQIRKVPWNRQVIATPQNSDIALIMYAKNKNGKITGITYSHGQMMSFADNIGSFFTDHNHNTLLSLNLLFSILGPVLGITTIIPKIANTEQQHPDWWHITETVIDQGVFSLIASPGQLLRITRYIKENRIKTSSLKQVISLGAPLTPSQINYVGDRLPVDAQVYSVYCADDMSPIASIEGNEVQEHTQSLSSNGFGNCMGRPLEERKVNLIKISDTPIASWSEDLAVPRGETGEIIIKKETPANHPSGLEKQDMDTINKNGNVWLRTGDLGWMDKENRIWYCGRKSQRIVSENNTIYTIPCEMIFNTHESVAQTAVVGVGPEGNKTPVVCVELEDENILSKQDVVEQLTALAEQHLITKHVNTILFHDALPMKNGNSMEPMREKLAKWAEKKLKTGGR